LSPDRAQAFVTDIATQHGRKLRRYLAARLRNAADVPDLVQEVFLRLMRIQKHESIRNPEAYVMTIAAHVLHQHMLRSAAAPETLGAVDVLLELQNDIDSDPAARADAQRRLEDLDHALERLAPKLHAAFVLHRRDGMTLDEIAEILGCSRPMVKKYLAKAVFRCREQLDPEAFVRDQQRIENERGAGAKNNQVCPGLNGTKAGEDIDEEQGGRS